MAARLTARRRERAFRPPEERELRRRKSFALDAMDAAEAALQLEALDHDFLFHDQRSDADLLLYRRETAGWR